jgi:hypothetical protein
MGQCSRSDGGRYIRVQELLEVTGFWKGLDLFRKDVPFYGRQILLNPLEIAPQFVATIHCIFSLTVRRQFPHLCHSAS